MTSTLAFGSVVGKLKAVRSFTVFLALKHIRRRLLQSLLTVLGVAVGVMVLVTALSLTNGFIAELVRSTLEATPHITLTSFDRGSSSTFPYDEALLEELETYPDVVAASPYIETQALIARRANAVQGLSARQGYTQIIGIDVEKEQNVLADLPVLAEQATAISQEKGIVIGSSLANRTLGVIPGDEVQILNIVQGRETFIVADSFHVGNELIDSAVSMTSIPTLQDYLNKPGEITGYHVRVKDPEEAIRIATQLGNTTGLYATPWQNLYGNLLGQMRLQKALISFVVFLIVLVAAMGIANILILTVAEKTPEIGILRAMGATQGQILRTFMYEGFILGITGTVLGVLLGLGISIYFEVKPFPLPGDLYFITQLPVELQLFDFVWVCALSLVTSVIAGLIPARRASSLNPIDVLK
ncbi:MAG: ABC transporter permease [Trueperaceae bacterium]